MRNQMTIAELRRENAELRRQARNARREAEIASARVARLESELAKVRGFMKLENQSILGDLELRNRLASGETCIRVAAEERGLAIAELKRQLYGRVVSTVAFRHAFERDGLSVRQIADLLNIDYATVYSRLKSVGVVGVAPESELA